MRPKLSMLRICSVGLYAEQYEKFVRSNIDDSVTYEDALMALRRSGMLYPSGFCGQMNILGIEANDIVPDFPFLQSLWKKEHGIEKNNIFFQQIQYYKPDIVYFQELDVISHGMRRSLKKRYPFIKAIVGFKGFPSRMFADYSDLDHIFISYPYFQKAWKAVGVSSTILPHCFDPGTNFTSFPEEKTHHFTFLGSTGYGNIAQEGRYYDLAYFLKNTSLEIWGREPKIRTEYESLKGSSLRLLALLPPSFLHALRRSNVSGDRAKLLLRDALLVREGSLRAIPWYIGKKPLGSLYPDRVHSPVSGAAYMAIIASSRISLNRHTDEPWEGGNIRTFEVAGSQSCLLTDFRPNISKLFSDEEIVTYTSPADGADKARYLLEHPKEAEAIAKKGHDRVMREHTTAHRVNTILFALKGILGEFEE